MKWHPMVPSCNNCPNSDTFLVDACSNSAGKLLLIVYCRTCETQTHHPVDLEDTKQRCLKMDQLQGDQPIEEGKEYDLEVFEQAGKPH